MQRKRSSSPISAPCRCEWRPSRWLLLAQCALALMAGMAVLMSGMAASAAWPSALLLVAAGLYRAWRDGRQPPVTLVVNPGDGPVQVDGKAVTAFKVHWQGPLVIAHWCSDGARHACVFLPDTLPAAQQRELRLAMQARGVSQFTRVMAP